MPLVTDTPTNPDERTGTRRLDLWSGSAEGGSYGDMARGTAYSARYLSDMDGGGCAEIAVYPIECEDGTFGVEEMATIGPAVEEDGIWRPDDSADITYEWASDRVFMSIGDAQGFADRYGPEDQSYALYLRPREIP